VKRVGARRVFSVRDLTAAIGRRFADIPAVWVEAEVHNLRRRGGQVYFTLRDDHQIDASMNAIVFDRLPVRALDGRLVHAYGRVEFWAGRSQVGMRVERVEPAGEGALLARIEALKAALAAEGLLDDARRRPLPVLPRRIGLVTSARGAARDDVLNNLWARFPPADVVLVDVPVQGEAAPGLIARALALLGRTPGVDVVIVARGGGPLEDLMAFNSEEVCRAVAASPVPVVSAVGHEKDVTVCDLVADVRVSTPTKAAEAVVPDERDLLERLEGHERRLVGGLVRVRSAAETRYEQRTTALVAALRALGARSGEHVAVAGARLAPSLRRIAAEEAARVPRLQERLTRGVAGVVEDAGRRTLAGGALLEALSPARTVARGYAIVRAADGRPLVDAAAMRAGDAVELEMRDGRAAVEVTEVTV
jgi:exodeoxyribonuclease VII large subunit